MTNLFLAGFQKCGSSSLFDLLSAHPDIVGCKPKETYFFTDPSYEHFDFNFNYTNPACNPSELYDHKATYYMEGSVCNFYQENALNYASANQDLRVIFIVRDPIERFVSVYNYFGSNGLFLEPGTGIEEYYQLARDKSPKSELLRYGLEHGKYCTFIDRWKNEIGSDRIHVTSIKRITKNNDLEMTSIWQFLNLQPVKIEEISHKNKTYVVRYPKLHSFIVQRFGRMGLAKSFLANIYNSLNRTLPSQKLPDTIRNELMEIYKDEYSRYSTLF